MAVQSLQRGLEVNRGGMRLDKIEFDKAIRHRHGELFYTITLGHCAGRHHLRKSTYDTQSLRPVSVITVHAVLSALYPKSMFIVPTLRSYISDTAPKVSRQ